MDVRLTRRLTGWPALHLTEAYVEQMFAGMPSDSSAPPGVPKEFELEGHEVRTTDGARLTEPGVAPKRLMAVLAELGPVIVEFPDIDADWPPLDVSQGE